MADLIALAIASQDIDDAAPAAYDDLDTTYLATLSDDEVNGAPACEWTEEDEEDVVEAAWAQYHRSVIASLPLNTGT